MLWKATVTCFIFLVVTVFTVHYTLFHIIYEYFFSFNIYSSTQISSLIGLIVCSRDVCTFRSLWRDVKKEKSFLLVYTFLSQLFNVWDERVLSFYCAAGIKILILRYSPFISGERKKKKEGKRSNTFNENVASRRVASRRFSLGKVLFAKTILSNYTGIT